MLFPALFIINQKNFHLQLKLTAYFDRFEIMQVNKSLSSRLIKLLAIWMAFVSMGWTVSFHYCKDKLAGITVLGEQKTCCASSKASLCTFTHDDDCCKNESLKLSLDQDFLQSELSSELLDLKLVLAPFSLRTLSHDSGSPISFQYYRPPPLVKDIPVLVCSFLI